MKNASFINSYDFVKELIENANARRVFEIIDYHFISESAIEYSDRSDLIFELVVKYGEGFVVDICERVRKENIRLSDKQRWCIAFALLKISADKVEALRKENEEDETISSEMEHSACDVAASAKNIIKLYHGSATAIEVENDRPMYFTPDINVAKEYALGLDDCGNYNEESFIYEIEVDASAAVIEEDFLYFDGAGYTNYPALAEITFCPECGYYLVKHPASITLIEFYKNTL